MTALCSRGRAGHRIGVALLQRQPVGQAEHGVVVVEAGQPVAYERYRVTAPDGTVREGFLNAKGLGRVDGIDPGTCKITFPNLDKDAWEPA